MATQLAISEDWLFDPSISQRLRLFDGNNRIPSINQASPVSFDHGSCSADELTARYRAFAAPTASAIFAPLRPSGFSPPSVESRAV